MNLKVLSDIFLRLVKTIIAPLVFATLVVGIAGHADLKQVGRMGIKALVYFEVVTTFALFIGLAAINFSKAGMGINRSGIAADTEQLQTVEQSTSDIILHIFPENIAKSVANGEVLQVVVFAIIFAIGLAMVHQKYRQPLLTVTESLSVVMFKFTNVVMFFAPIGVGGAIAYTVGKMGFGPLLNAFQLLLTLYAALIAFVLLVLLPVALLARLPVKRIVLAIAEPVSIAFATTSSEAALPRAMEAMESVGVPRRIVAFVMPTGFSLQPRRHHALPLAGGRVRGPGSGRRSVVWPAAGDGVHAYAHQQGRGRRAPRLTRDSTGYGGFVQPARLAGIYHSGH